MFRTCRKRALSVVQINQHVQILQDVDNLLYSTKDFAKVRPKREMISIVETSGSAYSTCGRVGIYITFECTISVSNTVGYDQNSLV